ncbi:auxin-responsive protein SAUR36-like [Aristolochia californica]|uniref:auxin-responsive protein SAUR36-like n=1 Tax=Aristolochia californica TaxID=171875 RepID=UPI0035D5838E
MATPYSEVHLAFSFLKQLFSMLSPKKIIHLARNRQEASFMPIADKGQFVAYTTDGERFMVPLAYLSNTLLNALLEVSEDEFGLPGDGPITLPCTVDFMEYVLLLMQRRPNRDVEKAVPTSITTARSSTPSVIH